MESLNVTVDTYLDTRRAVNGKYPLKLRVTYNRISKLRAIKLDNKNVYLSENEYHELLDSKCKLKHVRNMRSGVEALKTHATQIANKMAAMASPFTFKKFWDLFFGNKSTQSECLVYQGFKNAQNEMVNRNSYSTSKLFQATLNALSHFTDMKRLGFLDVDVAFLKDFEKYLMTNPDGKLTKALGVNGVSSHMRLIRRVYNDAIENGWVESKYYPFGAGRSKYKIRTERPRQRTLDQKYFNQLYFDYHPIPGSGEWEAKYYFFFSYLCHGINPVDMISLKWDENIEDEWIIFRRTKTRNKLKSQKTIRVPLTDQLKEILDMLGDRDSEYVFPIIERGLNDQQVLNRKSMFIGKVNKHLKRIAKELDFPIKGNLTMYYARHGWATHQLENGTNLKLISDGLGHTSLSTTEIYLGSSSNEQLISMNKNLLNKQSSQDFQIICHRCGSDDVMISSSAKGTQLRCNKCSNSKSLEAA